VLLSGTGYRESLELALSLHPSTRHLLVIAQGPRNNTTFNELVRAELGPLESRVRLDYVAARSLLELLATVEAAPQESLIYYLSYSHDEPGEIKMPPKIAALVSALVSEASPVPVYGILEVQMGSGVVGGVVRRRSDGGRQMAGLAIQILDGARAQDLPFVEATLVAMFDWRQLRRWGIDLSRLPPGSEIRFREPTAWERYQWPIVGVLTVLSLQAAIIGALLVQRRQRRRAEVALRESEEEARASYDEVQDLAGRLISAREGERTRITRDLHDDIGRRVASLSIALSRIQRQIPDASTPAKQSLSDLEQQSTQLSADLRHLPSLRTATRRHRSMRPITQPQERRACVVRVDLASEVGIVGTPACW
jgi:hypothetical protein